MHCGLVGLIFISFYGNTYVYVCVCVCASTCMYADVKLYSSAFMCVYMPMSDRIMHVCVVRTLMH